MIKECIKILEEKIEKSSYSDQEFSDIIMLANYIFNLKNINMGDTLRISRTSISKWISGQSLPHDTAREPLCQKILEVLGETKKEASKPDIANSS